MANDRSLVEKKDSAKDATDAAQNADHLIADLNPIVWSYIDTCSIDEQTLAATPASAHEKKLSADIGPLKTIAQLPSNDLT